MGDKQLCVWDLCGEKSLRSLWKNYIEEVTGVIYVVDPENKTYMENLAVLSCYLKRRVSRRVQRFGGTYFDTSK